MSILFLVGMLGLGVGVGFVSAALGIGGGIMMVPAFRELGLDAHTAKGTSMFIIIFVAAANTWRLNRNVKSEPWKLVAAIAGGSILGGYFGAWITEMMSEKTVTWIFVIVLSIVTVRLFMLPPDTAHEEKIRHDRFVLAFFIGLAASTVSGMTGIGGGQIFVPLALLACIVANARVTALSNAVMIITCIAASLKHFTADQTYFGFKGTIGQVNLALVPLVFLGAQVGSPVGKWVNEKLTLKRRKTVMGVLLLVFIVRMSWRAWHMP